jgi:hypothetical protein
MTEHAACLGRCAEVVWVGHLEAVVEAFHPSLVRADLALQCTRLHETKRLD